MPESDTVTLPKMLTEQHVADVCNLKLQTLRNWRSTKTAGPPWCKLGGAVRYPADKLRAWIEQSGKQQEATR